MPLKLQSTDSVPTLFEDLLLKSQNKSILKAKLSKAVVVYESYHANGHPTIQEKMGNYHMS
jgi:hypothetical protein